MSIEEDECDSSNLFTNASQSDVTSFLHTQTAKITDLNGGDDNESLIDNEKLLKSKQFISKKSFLNHSCFASISSKEKSLVDDLTELNWLNTFQFKEFQNQKLNNNDQISQLSTELKSYSLQNINISFGVAIFLALYSKHNDQQIPWSLTIKQLYEYIQINLKQLIIKQNWKYLLKQTLIKIPCFIQIKHDTFKSSSSSLWTIDPYYRPLLTKAYLTNKIIPDEKQSELIVNNFPSKATVKTKDNKNKQIEKFLINENNELLNKSIITTRSQILSRNIKNSFIHRRKSSSPKKRLSPYFFTHRPNTRINKKIIEQDLELLRQGQPLDLSSNNNNNNLLNQSSIR